MSMKRFVVVGISVILLFLAGCSNEPYVTEEVSGTKAKTETTEKTLTLEIEQSIRMSGLKYRFIGFANEDTIVFEKAGSEVYRQVYHPTEVGYTFRFGVSPNWEFEIVEANRKEGFITLRMTEKNGG